MSEHILFLTGKLAEKSLRRVLEALQPEEFTWDIHVIGVNVAALMTAEMVKKRLKELYGADRVIVPGMCRGNLQATSDHFGVPMDRGPVDLKDLPVYFGRGGVEPDLSRYEALIFAEIVDAPNMSIDEILAQAALYKRDGADVIDIGCLPESDFPLLEDAVRALKQAGYTVSVDSMSTEELRLGALAGADYLLSLKESTLHLASEVDAIPILIPEEPGDMASLYRAIDQMLALGKPFLADSILDPIHFGFSESVTRYVQLRRDYPDIGIMMGNGNITELTEADTSGMNAILQGIVSELSITAMLTTQVSPHACSVVRETDRARRIMYAAREDNALPKGYDSGLCTTHARKPFPYSTEEVAEIAAQIRDPSYRVQLSSQGIHVFNRDGMQTSTDPFELFPQLALLTEDAPHAFYMGVELAKAQIAWQLGKRYIQDEELEWGTAVYRAENEDLEQQKQAGSTLKASQKNKNNQSE